MNTLASFKNFTLNFECVKFAILNFIKFQKYVRNLLIDHKIITRMVILWIIMPEGLTSERKHYLKANRNARELFR